MPKRPQKATSASNSTTSSTPRTRAQTPLVSSPASTGGAGTFFEQHVNAYWLAHLLVGAIPPILTDCMVKEVHFQTEHLGWHTDDFLVVAQNEAGSTKKLVGQVKRNFTISSSDKDCVKAIEDFWQDFKKAQPFSLNTDRFILVTLRGTNVLLESFSGLLECARVARNGIEFADRLATPGFINKKSITYCDTLCAIIGNFEQKPQPVSHAEVWGFLRLLYILSLDLASSTRSIETIILSLLAYTSHQQDKGTSAEASWNALLRLVSDAMPAAKSFRFHDLPTELRQRHSVLGSKEQQVLRTLHEHSKPILDGIRSKIGNKVELPRKDLVQKVLTQLEIDQVVLISGAAGSGKSSIAKEVATVFAHDYFVFSFRAEEFAYPHLDTTLQNNHITVNAVTLSNILVNQARKILLVESVERLLESSVRDAFTDLLKLVANDPSWCLLLTCRDYATHLIISGLLAGTITNYSVVDVPSLNHTELEEVSENYPILAPLLAHPPLRQFLRTPYILDKTLQIPWSMNQPLPESERDLRIRFWQEIVRAEHRTRGGMPRRREDVFIQIAIRRAQQLVPYIACNDLDQAVLDSLRHDSLLVVSPQSSILIAPAHDVLEDWAILQWIDEQYTIHNSSIQQLPDIIGAYPAVRRTYRKWIAELVQREPQSANELFQETFQNKTFAEYFRDDTLVSLLRSPFSAALANHYQTQLFANTKEWLWRIIHIVRVACVVPPLWASTMPVKTSLLNVPDGSVWASLAQLLADNLDTFVEDEHSILLGFIEDWARSVTQQTPYPEGANAVAKIAYGLLDRFNDYGTRDQRQRLLKIIVKIPLADKDRFSSLLHEPDTSSQRDRIREEMQTIIFTNLEGIPVARDMPDLLIAMAKNYFLYSESDLDNDAEYGYIGELEPIFGIKPARSHDSSPASAYHGPFFSLLLHHPQEGIDFVIDVFNHSADWYAHPRVPTRHIELPLELTLTFNDEISVIQWGNIRLWNMYRGTSVGPYALQSLAMAFERWLLDYAEQYPFELDELLLSILRNSRSVSLTAVIASIATAFPHSCGETILVLLQNPFCIFLDRHRFASEFSAPSMLSFTISSPGDRIYEEERKIEDSRPHRKSTLEHAVMNLQLGSFAGRVHAILDRYREQMPAIEDQDEDDRIWRLALHQMDLRQYVGSVPVPTSNESNTNQTSRSDQQVLLKLNEPDSDIKNMIDQDAIELNTITTRLNLDMWGHKVFYREDTTYNPNEWKQRLHQVLHMTGEDVPDDIQVFGQNGPGLIAAISVRDHWDEMASDEQAWCLTRVCKEIEQRSNNWNPIARGQKNQMAADRACARVLPLLLGKTLVEDQTLQIRRSFVIALTHAVEEVREHVALGIGQYLWSIDAVLTWRCINALATEARIIQQKVHDRDYEPSTNQPSFNPDVEAALFIRDMFFEKESILENTYETMNLMDRDTFEIYQYILNIIVKVPDEPLSVIVFEHVAKSLVEVWDRVHSHNRTYQAQRNLKGEYALSGLLQRFLLQTSKDASLVLKPLLEAVDRYPDEVSRFIRDLGYGEDIYSNTPEFWRIWKLFADKVRSATWLSRIDRDRAHGHQLIAALFLRLYWKEGVQHWKSLEGYTSNIEAFFEDLPPIAEVLDNYVKFLYDIGGQSLPRAFLVIAQQLQKGDSQKMLRKGDTIFMLEVLLQRYVYGHPREVKTDRQLRDAIFNLLDILVDNGSSAAYQMRDDFVTPLINNGIRL
ncbi:AAA family ATPase [Herpetosiphon llansteffanensis]|uniref:AAA family ATPase n=1 Tax=Herpetosiphon llansteffanensis TaxID=2094568 RepID=UPI000D7B9C28|nr:AAA family ATPase [Herpetosiphon llansteffanensis]